MEGTQNNNQVIEDLVAKSDTGLRGSFKQPLVGYIVLAIAIIWSLFQLWSASPLPFVFNFGVLNDTQTRSIHLGFALFLTFLVNPAFSSSSRNTIPIYDWLLAILAAFSGAYLFLFHDELSERPGQLTQLDLMTAFCGLILLLEATRRAVGFPMVILAIVFIAYVLFGPYLPEVLEHKGASVNRMLSQMWIGTEGVFGVALGVSSGAIFVYVLFGALLDKAGGGNYMMQVSYAALGHLRGGPAKVAVVSSALNGLISGSSVSNVVSGGIFTIPLMKKAGYGGVKAGAIETMSSVNGQIMPPVMGAAAFLMVEYVGIPYSEIIKHAFLPAVLSYIALFYIVHLEALKLKMLPLLQASSRPVKEKLLRMGIGVSSTIICICVLYYLFKFFSFVFGDYAILFMSTVMAGIYVVTVKVSAQQEDLPDDIDINNPVARDAWPTLKAGLHFLIPIGTLIWLLMIENLSPALSAFWACFVLILLMLTQRVLLAYFRGNNNKKEMFNLGLNDVMQGLNNGARNMVGVAVATATAGIIVGAIALTGLGLRMTEFVEYVSQGNVILMLFFTAFVCLVLGLGVPTTANYVLVATLMAPVIVELGAQGGIIIPLIAVHLFVFYYGIMGDITPPVGLATFAAAAISGESAIATGIQGSIYALRTVVLPFMWIFNPAILLINVQSWFEVVIVAIGSLFAMLAFTALTMNWMRVKCKLWESAALVLVIALLFRPNFFMDLITPEYNTIPAEQLIEFIDKAPSNTLLVANIEGMNLEGDDVKKTVAVNLGELKAQDSSAMQRLTQLGLQLSPIPDGLMISSVKFSSPAKKGGFEAGFTITHFKVPSGRPSPYWFYILGFAILGLVWYLQGVRLKEHETVFQT